SRRPGSRAWPASASWAAPAGSLSHTPRSAGRSGRPRPGRSRSPRRPGETPIEDCDLRLMKRGRAVPLDWNDVVRRYKDGAEIEPTHGVATVSVSGADDEKVYIKHRMWEAALSRHNLEKAVTLLERGKMTRKSDDFIDQ